MLEPVLPYVDYLLPSIAEARMLYPDLFEPTEIADRLLNFGSKLVIIKMGGEGVFVKGVGFEGIQYPALPARVVDTLGAGDCFNAGFILSIVRGWSIEEAVHFGLASAACGVESAGATEGIVDYQSVHRRYSSSRSQSA